MRWDKLDFYGDGGVLLKSAVPLHELTSLVKEARFLGTERRPEHDHALIVMDGVEHFPLFPTVDAGNTMLSAHYLMLNSEHFPDEAVKLAAANISAACIAFGTGVPDALLDLAGGDTEVRSPMFKVKRASTDMQTGAAPIPGAASPARVAGAPAPPRGNVPPVLGVPAAPKPATMKEAVASFLGLQKTAAPVGQVTSKLTAHGKVRVRLSSGSSLLASNNTPQPFTKTPKPKLASAPFEQVKAAADWFNSEWKGISPEDRVKVASSLLDACEPLGIYLVDEAHVYGRGVGDLGITKVALRVRSALSGDPIYSDLEKVAAGCSTEEMVELLWEADVASGLSRHWNSRIGDPFLSVMTKVANLEQTSLLKGETTVTNPDAIKNLATNGFRNVSQVYGEDFAVKFRARPVEVFKSLPDPNREHLARLSISWND